MIKEFNVKGMHCKSCETILKDSIGDLPGVSKVSASAGEGVVKVNFDEKKLSDSKITEVIKKEGYGVTSSK